MTRHDNGHGHDMVQHFCFFFYVAEEWPEGSLFGQMSRQAVPNEGGGRCRAPW